MGLAKRNNKFRVFSLNRLWHMSTLDYLSLIRIRTWNRRAQSHYHVGSILPGSMICVENKENGRVSTNCSQCQKTTYTGLYFYS